LTSYIAGDSTTWIGVSVTIASAQPDGTYTIST
jgi:hypothetical protein